MKLHPGSRIALVIALVASFLAVAPSAEAHPCEIDIDIFDGAHTKAAPPVPVPEESEETRGAFTVQNRNDTNANDVQDIDDAAVAKEVDLMKIVLSVDGQSEASRLTVGGADKVRLWSSATKGTKLVPEADEEPTTDVYNVTAAGQTLWAEGIKASESVRDVSFSFMAAHVEPQPPPAPEPSPIPCDIPETATATIVWAKHIDEKHDVGDAAWTGLGDPPKDRLKDRCGAGGTNPPQSFGLRPITKAHGVANCIGMRFQVFPEDVGDEPGVTFDITRQMRLRGWKTKGAKQGGWKLANKANILSGDEANDDKTDEDNKDTDESNKPNKDGFLFAIDGPGPTFAGADAKKLIQRFNMLEFVRVRFDGAVFHGDTKEGSRCSFKFKWYASHTLTASGGDSSKDVWERTTGDDPEVKSKNAVGQGHLPDDAFDKPGEPD